MAESWVHCPPRDRQLFLPRQPRAGEADEGSGPAAAASTAALVPRSGSSEIRTGAAGLGEPSPGWQGARVGEELNQQR